jgi:hypothetical protein
MPKPKKQKTSKKPKKASAKKRPSTHQTTRVKISVRVCDAGGCGGGGGGPIVYATYAPPPPAQLVQFIFNDVNSLGAQ